MAGKGILKRLRELAGPEALATGIGAGAIFGGPVGLVLGLAQGVLAKRERDKEGEEISAIEEIDTRLREQLAGARARGEAHAGEGTLDRAQLEEQLAAHDTRRANLAKLARVHPNARVREKAASDLAALDVGIGTWLEDVEGRRDAGEDSRTNVQRELVKGLALDLRKQYHGALSKRRDLQANAGQIHELLNSADFDPNKPLNRGRLIDLMKSSSRTILADTQDFADALSNAGGNSGWISQIVGLVSGAMKAEDFKFTKAEWRAIATALYDAETRQHAAAMQGVEEQVGGELEVAAHELGILPSNLTLADFVTGDTDEFPRPYSAGPYPEIAEAAELPPTGDPAIDKSHLATGQDAFARLMRAMKKRADELEEKRRNKGRRPTN